jgi:hypothetical protein
LARIVNTFKMSIDWPSGGWGAMLNRTAGLDSPGRIRGVDERMHRTADPPSISGGLDVGQQVRLDRGLSCRVERANADRRC